jgi:hypothetical protein
MKIIVLSILNAGQIAFFIYLLRRPSLLSYNQGGRTWLTFFAVGIITLLDEFTSIFYAPAEAYRFIGPSALVFIAVNTGSWGVNYGHFVSSIALCILAYSKVSLFSRIVSLLRVVEYELPHRQVSVHLGWPLSSWIDRLAIGVMVFNLMRLPRLFPHFEFDIRYQGAGPPPP